MDSTEKNYIQQIQKARLKPYIDINTELREKVKYDIERLQIMNKHRDINPNKAGLF